MLLQGSANPFPTENQFSEPGVEEGNDGREEGSHMALGYALSFPFSPL